MYKKVSTTHTSLDCYENWFFCFIGATIRGKVYKGFVQIGTKAQNELIAVLIQKVKTGVVNEILTPLFHFIIVDTTQHI